MHLFDIKFTRFEILLTNWDLDTCKQCIALFHNIEYIEHLTNALYIFLPGGNFKWKRFWSSLQDIYSSSPQNKNLFKGSCPMRKYVALVGRAMLSCRGIEARFCHFIATPFCFHNKSISDRCNQERARGVVRWIGATKYNCMRHFSLHL